MLNLYLNFRKKELYNQISKEIKKSKIQEVVQTVFVKGYLVEKRLIKGHKYYLDITDNKAKLLKTEKFMHTFKAKYGLSYVDNERLSILEANKNEILNCNVLSY